MTRILFVDLSERDWRAREGLVKRKDQLNALKETKDKTGGLSAAQQAELEFIESVLLVDRPADLFYQTVAATLEETTWEKLVAENRYLLEHGLFGTQRANRDLSEKEQQIAAVCGLLQLDNAVDATHQRFKRRISEAKGEYLENKALFDEAFRFLSGRFQVSLRNQIEKDYVHPAIVGCVAPSGSVDDRAEALELLYSTQGDLFKKKWLQTGIKPRAANPAPAAAAARRSAARLAALQKKVLEMQPSLDDDVLAISGRSVAAVVRRLAEDRISANDPWLRSRMENAFDLQTGLVDGAPPSAIDIELPDLEESVDVDIQKENLHAAQAIYFSYMLEEMRMFQVVERIVQLFRQGLLPLGRGAAGNVLFSYYRKSAERITETERRDLYMRLFGAPGGNPAAAMDVNAGFNDQMLRAASAVSTFARQINVEKLLRNPIPMAVSQAVVGKSLRELGTGLSRSAYGIAYFAATELQQTINEFIDLLRSQEILNAFGARDMYQVIDQVNVNYLGGAKSTHRYRTQARAGAVIIRWIANNAARLSNQIGGDVISIEQLTNAQLRAASAGNNPMINPTDWDLVNACEQWLAVGGVQDQAVEQYSQPIEAPVMTSRPIEMPQAARDVLEAVGVNLPGF